MIGKTATIPTFGQRRFGHFARARDAFGAVLDTLSVGAGDAVLLPAYIGWSPREGSGVFDPISARGILPLFYRLDERLRIDEADVLEKIRASGAKALLLIHYFGFVDPAFARLAAAAKAMGMAVVEDAAHALFTDFVGGRCGRTGDYTLYSLHKLLPFSSGGMLAANGESPMPATARETNVAGDPFAYDYYALAHTITGNYAYLANLLEPLSDELTPLYPVLPEGVVPQTFPVLVNRYDRYRLYNELNAAGYGAVALYHTLIEPLRTNEWTASAFAAKRLLNFPVHQDATQCELAAMVGTLKELLSAQR